MRLHEIENWARDIIERVQRNQPIEDTRVELKADWTPPEKAARRLAGHANAARGEPILWLIGVDQDRGVVGVEYLELSSWQQKVEARFDGLAPDLTDLNVPVGNEVIVALFFDTSRRPFVVKNPFQGLRAGDPVELEVPWREGTRVRSARRADLIRLLSPVHKLPQLEVTKGVLRLIRDLEDPDKEWRWDLHLELYAETASYERVVFPNRKCEVALLIPDVLERTFLEDISLLAPRGHISHLVMFRPSYSDSPPQRLSQTIDNSPSQLVIDGPGAFTLKARGTAEPGMVSFDPDRKSRVEIVGSLVPAAIGGAAPFSVTLDIIHFDGGKMLEWRHE